MNDVIIYQFKPRGWFSKSIAWYTRGNYSHTGFMLDGIYYESNNKDGVISMDRKTFTEKIFFKYIPDQYLLVGEPNIEENVSNKKAESLLRMIAFAQKQVGKKYDHRMVSGFVTRKSQEDRKSSEKWFCSELVFAVLRAGGFNLFNCEPWQVSPNLVPFSPLVKKI